MSPRLTAVSTSASSSYSVNTASDIGRKWLALGGASGPGVATGPVTAIFAYRSSYQTFQNGAIVYTSAYGACYITQEIFAKWMSLRGQRSPYPFLDLMEYVGSPTEDVVRTGGGEFKRRDTATFTAGLISSSPGGDAFVIWGAIYERWATDGGKVGLPMSDSTSMLGQRIQKFSGGNIYTWGASGVIVRSEILAKYEKLGGPTGLLGMPTASDAPLTDKAGETRRAARFQKGSIYYSSDFGACALTKPLSTVYDNYGGPTGWLGLPKRDTVDVRWGESYSDFVGGVLVHFDQGFDHPGDFAFRNLELRITHLEGLGSDWGGLADNQELFTRLEARGNNGFYSYSRFPDHGQYDDKFDGLEVVPLNNGPLEGGLSVEVTFRGFDWDDFGTHEQPLGTIQKVLNVDNLWGTQDDTRWRSGDFSAVCKLSATDYPYDASAFRQDMFWSFQNVVPSPFRKELFDRTFSDVRSGESKVWNFWDTSAFEGMRDLGGLCYGMSTEAIYARLGKSLYPEPLYVYFSDLENGTLLDTTKTSHARLQDEIMIKQAYQYGFEPMGWEWSQISSGMTHNPMDVFEESKFAFDQGNYPSITVRDEYIGGSGHQVLPYRWEKAPGLWTIHVADPNRPGRLGTPTYPKSSYRDESSVITIDTRENTFRFEFEPGDVWTGGKWEGGRMGYLPFAVVAFPPHTPTWPLGLGVTRTYTSTVSKTARTDQVTDGKGRTLFDPNLSGPPERWRDFAIYNSIPGLARLSSIGGGSGGSIERYVGEATGTVTHEYQIEPRGGVASGTPYEWSMSSSMLSAKVTVPGTSGKPDVLAAMLGGDSDAVSVAVPKGGDKKTVSMQVSGPDLERSIKVDALEIAPGQKITVSVANDGQRLQLGNANGPSTSAHVVYNGPGGATDGGTITVGRGSSGGMEFDAPRTTAVLSGSMKVFGRYWGPVLATLEAKDFSSKGIEYIEYRLDNGAWRRYATPLQLDKIGTSRLRFRAKDKAGYVGAENEAVIRISDSGALMRYGLALLGLIGAAVIAFVLWRKRN